MKLQFTKISFTVSIKSIFPPSPQDISCRLYIIWLIQNVSPSIIFFPLTATLSRILIHIPPLSPNKNSRATQLRYGKKKRKEKKSQPCSFIPEKFACNNPAFPDSSRACKLYLSQGCEWPPADTSARALEEDESPHLVSICVMAAVFSRLSGGGREKARKNNSRTLL